MKYLSAHKIQTNCLTLERTNTGIKHVDWQEKGEQQIDQGSNRAYRGESKRGSIHFLLPQQKHLEARQSADRGDFPYTTQ